jgi:anti-sigma B factor antagonist
MNAGGELLRITTVFEEDRWVVHLSGELDLSSANQLDTTIAELGADGAQRIVIEMAELQFMDSTGLRSLLVAGELCKVNGCELLIGSTSLQVERLFSVSGVDERLPRRVKAGEAQADL